MKRFIGFLLLNLIGVATSLESCPDSCCSSSGLFEIQEDKCILTKSAQRLTADIIREMGTSDRNVFISPFSVTNILQLLLLASSGTTELQLSHALSTQSIDIHQAAKCISEEIQKSYGTSLNYTNDFFVSNEYKGDYEDYKTHSLHFYRTSFYSCNYRQRPEGARKRINKIVKTKSRGLIENLFAVPGTVSNETKLIIVNTVTFKSDWLHKFDKTLSFSGKFDVGPNTKPMTTFMRVQGNFSSSWVTTNVADGTDIDISVLDMPYTTSQYSMMAFKFGSRYQKYRDLGELEDFVAENGILSVRSMLDKSPLEVVFPRFKMEYDRELNEIFTPNTDLGVVFSPRADFSNFAGDDGLFINSIIHKAAIEVTEEGTVASGASGGRFQQRDVNIMKFDSPFIFYIYHACDGLVLFQGRYAYPSGQPLTASQRLAMGV